MLEEIIETKNGFKTQGWEYTSYVWTDLNQTCPVANAVNTDKDGVKLFYEMTTGPYMNPVILKEPDLAFELLENIGDGKQKLAGIKTDDGQRFSISNAKSKKISLKWNKNEMSLEINNIKYWLQFLYEPDKAIFINYIGYFSKKKRTNDVKVYEMAEVLDIFFTTLWVR